MVLPECIRVKRPSARRSMLAIASKLGAAR